MIQTQIYRKYQIKKMGIFLLAFVALYVLLFKPAQAIKGADINHLHEKVPTVRSFEDSQDVLTELATPIHAEDLYIIYTQSNELIEIVDARSTEEYKAKHIEGSKSLETFKERFEQRYPPIRVFFYSNSNNRSKKVANMYADKGVKAYYVVGGLSAWEQLKGLTFLTSE